MIQNVHKFLRHSRPPDLTEDLQFKWFNDSLLVIDECLMFVDGLVFPKKFRKVALKLLHPRHPGIKRMKAIARSVVHGPNVDSDIEKTVKSCVSFMEAQKNPPRIVESHWTYPKQPWA